MKKLSIIFTFLIAFLLNEQVVFNEWDLDTLNTTYKEFIGLEFNAPNFLLDGDILVFFNGNPKLSAAKHSYFRIKNS